MYLRLTWLLTPLLHVICTANAVADTASSQYQNEINLTRAVVKTMQSNPELIALGYQLQVGKGLLTHAELAPNPKLQVELEDIFGSGDFNALKSAQTTISISWLLEQQRRQRRSQVARANLGLLETEQKVARIEKAAETARRYLICLMRQENLVNLSRSVTQTEDALDAAKKLVAASKVPAAEAARARADLAKKRLSLDDAHHELETSYRYLAAQWGETDPQFTKVVGNLRNLPTIEPYKTLLSRLQNNPEYARLASQRRVNESELALAKELGKPQWEIAAGVRRFEAEDEQALVMSLSVPLTLKNKNQGQIAASSARLSKLQADREVIDTQLKTELFSLYQELRHSEHRTTALSEVVIPNYLQALKETQQAYQRGRYSYLELQRLQDALIEANQDLIESAANAHLYLIEIERLTGEPVVQAFKQMEDSR